MKLGVFMALFGDQSLDDALDYVAELGLDTVEIGTGNYPGDPHCPLDELLESDEKRAEWHEKITSRGLEISALSCHGNPLHPDDEFAAANHEVQRKTIRLAEKLGVGTINTFSGCPGDSETSSRPNWVTCPWPPDFLETLEWQWNEKVIPYWTEEATFAADHGVRVAFEMHPGFVVYNTETMLRIREECGETLGANFDPSHLFWQGMDPLVSIKQLGDAIFHVHAKDCRIDPQNTAANGVLDTKHYGDELGRSWIFRTVGYGHGADFWTDFISVLRAVGYDDVLSIEHEDSLMSPAEGFEKAVGFLQDLLLREPLGEMWWA
ncbi:MAG: sugar phosphate isomerase/epimerase family protein [Planctomycetota bacterium]